jgi:hypothetical protein
MSFGVNYKLVMQGMCRADVFLYAHGTLVLRSRGP